MFVADNGDELLFARQVHRQGSKDVPADHVV